MPKLLETQYSNLRGGCSNIDRRQWKNNFHREKKHIAAQTPSQSELLTMVKKNSEMLRKVNMDVESASDVETNPRFWRDAVDLYFIRGKQSRGHQQDDLIFFVNKMSMQGHGSNADKESNSPYFVRRWTPKFDNLIGLSSATVDWRHSFYLNLIAQTSFHVTVAICSHQVLKNNQTGKDRSLSPLYKVVKTVYASPSRINFHLDSTKKVERTPAYPEICFAVEDFDSTFDAVVLTDVDHCYCVLLNAHDGAAFPSERIPEDCSPSDTSSSKSSTNSGKITSKITLFSGFVSCQMVRDAYEAGRFGRLLSRRSFPQTDRIYMRGPGGRGEVEVAVSGVVDQICRKGLSFSAVVRRSYAATSASRGERMIPLKCCLMSISLPWEYIAYNLLFKESPPVNM